MQQLKPIPCFTCFFQSNFQLRNKILLALCILCFADVGTDACATSADLVRNNGFPIFFKLPYKVYNTTENSIDSSASLFSFTKSPPVKSNYIKNSGHFHDASPMATWCICYANMMLLHLVSQWCDVCHKMWQSHTSLGVAVIIGEANIICRRQTSFKKRTFVGRQKCVFCWRARGDSNPRPTGS